MGQWVGKAVQRPWNHFMLFKNTQIVYLRVDLDINLCNIKTCKFIFCVYLVDKGLWTMLIIVVSH